MWELCTAYEVTQQLPALKALTGFSFASFSFLPKRKGGLFCRKEK
jgi:hypothetical protein